MKAKNQRTHARLRLDDFAQRSKWSQCNLTAASPLGSEVLFRSISETEDAARPVASPISDNVIPFSRRSETREDHVVGAGIARPILRDAVTNMQRHPVIDLLDAIGMPRPADLPRFETLGARIKYWRETVRGWDRRELCRRARIPYSTLAGIEDEEQKASTKVPQIAAALGVNPIYLSTDKGDPDPDTPPALVDWPFNFPPEVLHDFEPNELDLAGMKLQLILEDIRKKRTKPRSKKVS